MRLLLTILCFIALQAQGQALFHAHNKVIAPAGPVTTPLTWTGLVNMTESAGYLYKSGGNYWADDAYATTVETFDAGDVLEFKAVNFSQFIIGFSSSTSVSAPAHITSGLSLQSSREAYHWNGTNNSSALTLSTTGAIFNWADGDWFRIANYSGTAEIYYSRDSGANWTQLLSVRSTTAVTSAYVGYVNQYINSGISNYSKIAY